MLLYRFCFLFPSLSLTLCYLLTQVFQNTFDPMINDVRDKSPDFDTYGLLRATHYHVSAPLRSVLNMCHWHIAPDPIFAYRGIIIPLLCSYRVGSQGLSPTYEQAHVGLDLFTLVSINFSIIRQCFKVHTSFVFCRYIFMVV